MGASEEWNCSVHRVKPCPCGRGVRSPLTAPPGGRQASGRLEKAPASRWVSLFGILDIKGSSGGRARDSRAARMQAPVYNPLPFFHVQALGVREGGLRSGYCFSPTRGANSPCTSVTQGRSFLASSSLDTGRVASRNADSVEIPPHLLACWDHPVLGCNLSEDHAACTHLFHHLQAEEGCLWWKSFVG